MSHRRTLSRSSLLLLVATIALVLSSCSVTQYYARPLEQDYNNTYMFWAKANIIEEFGAPARIITDGNGLETLIYERPVAVKIQKGATAEGEYLEFHLDEGARCTQVKTNYTEQTPLYAKSKPTRKGIIWGSIGTAILVAEAIVLILTQ